MHKAVFLLLGTLIILSVNGCGGSSLTEPVVSASPASPPPVRARQVNTANNEASVTVTWQLPASVPLGDVQSFPVYRNGDLIASVAPPATGYVDDDARTLAGGEQTYRVEMIASTNGVPSTTDLGVATVQLTPAIPTVRAVYGSAEPPEVTVSWASPPYILDGPGVGADAVVEYHVYRDEQRVGVTQSGTQQFADTPALDGSTVSYLAYLGREQILETRTATVAPFKRGATHTYRVAVFSRYINSYRENTIGAPVTVAVPAP